MDSSSLNIAAIFTHPDDLSFFNAGTLAKWVEEGHKVYTICCIKSEDFYIY